MCGIAGIIAASAGTERGRADIERMVATLRHRGPDDAGIASGDGWAVGLTRLSIQDPTPAGHQPMQLDDLTLVFNGEVYNFPELRRELSQRGYAFRSGSDTEVVLAALHRWGPDALPRFNGMFALALIDARRRRALLARDRFGKKPLFLGRLERGVAFASELKALIAIARDELRVSRDAMAEFFRYQYVPAPRSIFEQVGKIPPASWIGVALDGGSVDAPVRYWELPGPHDGVPASPEEVLETVGRSVRRRLIADVPVGAFLSGGTDSSLVVACMRDAAADVRTFSIGFADPRFDESRYATAVARRLETRHTHEQLEWGQAINLVPSLAEAYDEPFGDSSALPTMAVSRLARRHVTVALSGDGGDELFGGYPRYGAVRPMRVAQRMPAAVGRALRSLPGDGRPQRRLRVFGELARARSEREVYRELVSVWRTAELARLVPGARDGDRFCAGFGQEGAGRVERMMRCDARSYLIDDILQKVDRASMAVSLEARTPLLDPEVVSVALRCADHAERGPGQKRLARRALELRLPKELVDRPKMGFGVPIGEWLRGGLRPLVEDLVLSRSSTLYDSALAHTTCRLHLSGERDLASQLWSLLVFELWRDRWLRGS
jgi:asparagine synthase (glutamine-hydrolysing)